MIRAHRGAQKLKSCVQRVCFCPFSSRQIQPYIHTILHLDTVLITQPTHKTGHPAQILCSMHPRTEKHTVHIVFSHCRLLCTCDSEVLLRPLCETTQNFKTHNCSKELPIQAQRNTACDGDYLSSSSPHLSVLHLSIYSSWKAIQPRILILYTSIKSVNGSGSMRGRHSGWLSC